MNFPPAALLLDYVAVSSGMISTPCLEFHGVIKVSVIQSVSNYNLLLNFISYSKVPNKISTNFILTMKIIENIELGKDILLKKIQGKREEQMNN